ncbi:MAG: YceI family protein [Flavobacteriaceae bacterium]|nr:YceI family protein [Flavobacteriaceae bacterium]
MKKNTFLFITLFIMFSTFSCKKEQKEVVEKEQNVTKYIIDAKNTVINWTAYKTTEKIPVKGVFNKVEILNSSTAANPIEVLKDIEFKIPVNSIFSKDSIRDYKLTTFLFGTMKNTSQIEGTINLDNNGKGNASITMNGLTKNIPVTYEVHGNDIKINTTIELDNWQAQMAITALNEVCLEKHKAADGVSKTWSEVDISVVVKTVTN